MSQTLKLLSRQRCRIACGEADEAAFNWSAIAPLPALTQPTMGEVGATRVRAVAGRKALFVRFECDVPDMAALAPNPGAAPLDLAEHAFVTIHPENDPGRWVRIRGDFRNMTDLTRFTRGLGEASLGGVLDKWQESSALKEPYTCYHEFSAGYWSIEFVIPWRTLGLKSAPATLGLGYGRQARMTKAGGGFASAVWPDPGAMSAWTSTPEHGEAMIGADTGAPDHLDLPTPRFGTNRATLVLGSNWGRRPTSLRVTSAAGVQQTSVTSSADRVEFTYALDRATSSHLNTLDSPRVRIELLAGEQVVYNVALPMDRHRGYCVDEPYGEPASGPAPSNLRDRVLDRITRKLPRLHRRTTKQGAPSDFSLVDDATGKVVNLMADEPMKDLAAIIESRFSTTEDRLLGAMALIGQKSVTNLILEPMFFNAKGQHSYHSPLHLMMGPLSIIRYGGGPAICRAASLARLLEHVTDPATGKKFASRIVSLHRNGGPRQVTDDKFEACTNFAPFIQHPGLVGCVAVEYGGSQTLLDPTALAFFAIDDKKLAAVEQITGDATLRSTGAGAMADIYGKLDIDELRRHRLNELHSKGVFPEACLDEQSPSRPFDPGHRQGNRYFHAVRGGDAAQVHGLTRSNGNSGHRDGSVSVAWNDAALTVIVSVTGISTAAFDHRDRATERVHLALDIAHEHAGFHRFVAGLDGKRSHTADIHGNIQTLFKHLTTENGTVEKTFGPEHWSADVKGRPDGYDVTYRIAWEGLSVYDTEDRPKVMGLNVWVDGRHPQYEQVLLCPQRFMLQSDTFNFADVYLAEPNAPRLFVDEIDFGVAYWGDNVGRVRVYNGEKEAREVVLQTRTYAGFSREMKACEPVRLKVEPQAWARADLPYYLDPRQKMASGNPQKLELTMRADEQTIYQGKWQNTYCGTIAGYQRYDLDPAKHPNPRPGENDFAEKKARYIASRIGVMKRLTTRDGAASDFIIRTADGKTEFNLMDDGVLEQMTGWAASLFDNDLDRVLGIFYLGYNPAVLRHMSYGHRIMEGGGPLTIMRGNFCGGGGNCGYHSRAFGGMLANYKHNGKYLGGHTLGVYGHVISAFFWKDTKVVIDNDVGHFILNADGTDFATIEEVRNEMKVTTTAGPSDLARYFTFSSNSVPFQKSVKGYPWPGVFPAGASTE